MKTKSLDHKFLWAFLCLKSYNRGKKSCEVFAYSTRVACDKHGWAVAYMVEAGNVRDSQAFPALFSKLEPFSPHYIIADSGYKTPAIAHYLLERTSSLSSLILVQRE